MATGSHHTNPIIEKSRTNGRALTLEIDVGAGVFTTDTDSFAVTYNTTDNVIQAAVTGTGANSPTAAYSIPFARWTDAADTGIGEVARGFKITSIELGYEVTTASIGDLVVALETCAMVDGSAVTAASIACTDSATLTASATLQNVETFTPATLPVLTKGTTYTVLITPTLASTAVFTLQAVRVNGTLLL